MKDRKYSEGVERCRMWCCLVGGEGWLHATYQPHNLCPATAQSSPAQPSPAQPSPARAMQVQTVTIRVVWSWSVIPWVKLPTNYHLNYNLHLHGSNSYIINHRVGAGTKIF